MRDFFSCYVHLYLIIHSEIIVYSRSQCDKIRQELFTKVQNFKIFFENIFKRVSLVFGQFLKIINAVDHIFIVVNDPILNK